MKENPCIIISRTDSIGDVMLTLPMCGWLKKHLPSCRLVFLGRSYTRDVVSACTHIDDFIDWDAIKMRSPSEQVDALSSHSADCILHIFPRKEILWIAKRAGIPLRICSGHRLHALTKCNKLVFFSRKNSDLHESQLNFKLLRPLGIPDSIGLAEIPPLYGFHGTGPSGPEHEIAHAFAGNRKKIILHPLSKGSAVEWALEKYQELALMLDPARYAVFITGTLEEGERLRAQGGLVGDHVFDATGKFDLSGLIVFIDSCDALIAASTGPLHIASALGRHAIGLYSPKRPIHPGRWSPVGKNAHIICAKEHPKKGTSLSISANAVLQVIELALP